MIVGGVFSHAEGFTDMVGLIPGYLFHAVCMVAGMFLINKAAEPKEAAVLQPAAQTAK